MDYFLVMKMLQGLKQLSHVPADDGLRIARFLTQVLKKRDAADEAENDSVAAGRGKKAARCRTDNCGMPARSHEKLELPSGLLPSPPLPVHKFDCNLGSGEDLLAPV